MGNRSSNRVKEDQSDSRLSENTAATTTRSSSQAGDSLIERFSSLIATLKSNCKSDPATLTNFICDNLPANKNVSFTCSDLIPQLREAQSLDEVFELIDPFIKFNRYNLLTYLVDKFGEERDKEELQQYSSSVETFNSTTTVDQLVKLMEEQQQRWTEGDWERLKIAGEQGQTIKMAFGSDYGSRSLDQLHSDVLSIFDCDEYVLALAEAHSGSIEMLWYTGQAAVGYLTEKARENIVKLEEIGMTALMVGHNAIKGIFPRSPSSHSSKALSQQPGDSLPSNSSHAAFSSGNVETGTAPPSQPEDIGEDGRTISSGSRESLGRRSSSTSSDSMSSDTGLYESIVAAIAKNNVVQVSELLKIPSSLDDLKDLLQQVDKKSSSLLHIAVSSENADIIKAVLSAIHDTSEDNLRWLTNANNQSPLHIAFQMNKLEFIELLLKYPSPATIPTSHQNLLTLATKNPDQLLVKLKLILEHSRGNPLRHYPNFLQYFPEATIPKSDIENTIPVIVVGNSQSGKSTLIKSLQIEGFKSQFFHLFFNVSGVTDHQSGVIPIPFESIWFGNVVFYDLSAHREFVHEAILQCGFLSDAVFIVVVNLHDKTEEITKQLVYWLNFVRYHHEKVTGRCDRPPNIIIVGSHLNQLRFGNLANRERFIYYAYPQARRHYDESQYNIITWELMDVRKSSVPNAKLRLALSQEFKRLRGSREQIPSKSYILYEIIKGLCSRRNVSYISVHEVLALLHSSEELHCQMIEPTVGEIMRLCKSLCELNLLVVLEDEEELERSWIIVDSQSLLRTVERVIFKNDSPKPGDGILSHDDLEALFSAQKVNPDMMIKLMVRYCYCTKLSPTVSPLPPWVRLNKYFFPHLLPEQPASDIPQQDLMFAWSVSPESPFHHFMPHFIHRFLLHLSQEPEISRENYDRARRTLVTSFPAIGLQLTVHIASDQTIIVSMRSESNSDKEKISCLEMRNRLIEKIHQVLAELDPDIQANLSLVEALISGKDRRHPVHYPVLKPPKIRGFFGGHINQSYSVEDVRLAVKERARNVRPIGHPEPLSSIEDLLFFEPYFYMSDEQRMMLKNPMNEDEIISSVYFEGLAEGLGLERLYLVLHALGISHIDVSQGVTFYQVIGQAHCFIQGRGVTYGKLRYTLDSISFFKLDNLIN